MASPLYVIQIKVIDAVNLQIANQGLPSFVEVWAHPRYKGYTLADPRGGSSPSWHEFLYILLPPGNAVEDAVLHVHVLHAGPELLVGSAELRLRGVLMEGCGGGRPIRRTIQLNPQGTVDAELAVQEIRWAPPTTDVVPPPPLPLPPPPPPPPRRSSAQEEDIGGMDQISESAEIFEGFIWSIDNSESAEDPYDLSSDDEASETSEEASETSSEDEDEDGDGEAVEIDLPYEDDGDDYNDNQPFPIVR